VSNVAVAVIGAGAIGRAHVETIRRSQRCTLAAEPAVQGKDYADRLGVPWCADHVVCSIA
jgi:homoserine dehydrogenase